MNVSTAMSRVSRWIRAILLAALLVASPSVALSQPANSAERALIDRWVAMWNSYDLREVEKIFVQGDSVSYFSSEYKGLVRGSAALKQHHERFGFVPGGKKAENRLWLEDMTIVPTSGTSSLVTAKWLFERPGGAPPQAGPVSFVLMRTEGGWRILHAHFSNDPSQ